MLLAKFGARPPGVGGAIPIGRCTWSWLCVLGVHDVADALGRDALPCPALVLDRAPQDLSAHAHASCPSLPVSPAPGCASRSPIQANTLVYGTLGYALDVVALGAAALAVDLLDGSALR